ncbi:MAG: addiction module protein [Cyclobacteriaceae bacterium]|nr:addiction module protein [Cyclobacteriaceae bacterium]
MELEELLRLSEAERIMAVKKIWDSLDKKSISLTEAQKEELDRRLESYHSGQTKFFSWEEVKHELHSSIKKKQI